MVPKLLTLVIRHILLLCNTVPLIFLGFWSNQSKFKQF